jgi:transposase
MLTWARQWPQRRWAVENAEGLGRHLTSWLLARGEDVVDVPTTATARVRQLSRGGGRKNDRIDAGAAACVAALQGDARPLEAEGYVDAMAVLDERRVNLAQSRVRAVNQLHALLRALIAGGAPRDLSATTAAALLRTIRPHGAVEQARKAVAKDLVTEIRTLDTQLKANAQAIARLVAATGSALTKVVGVGPIMAGRLISRTGRASRFSPHQLSPTTPVRPRWRLPAQRSPGIVSHATGIGNSTPPSTPSPSPKSAYPAAAATATTRARSPREKHHARRHGASRDASPTTSGGP